MRADALFFDRAYRAKKKQPDGVAGAFVLKWIKDKAFNENHSVCP
jgi:hypothetical protein